MAASRREACSAHGDRHSAASREFSRSSGYGGAGVSAGDEVFRRVQSAARAAGTKAGTGAPTQEYLIRHPLESPLDRALEGHTAAWDVSTGDPIVPAPRQVRIERDELLRSGRCPLPRRLPRTRCATRRRLRADRAGQMGSVASQGANGSSLRSGPR